MTREQKFHRRAQKAEGCLERAKFWVKCLQTAHDRNLGPSYITTVAGYAMSELENGTKVK